MFRQTYAAAFVPLAALVSFTVATAQEPKAVGGTKLITNSIGMKLTLVPSGEFMMGSGEPAETVAAYFNKTYGLDDKASFFADEYPQHRVRITKPFYLGTYQVTRGQFRQFVKDTGYITGAEKGEQLRAEDSNPDGNHRVFKQEKPGADGWDPEKKNLVFNAKYSWQNAGFAQTDEHPVLCVSWNDAVAFCKWLSDKEGKIYRLPTEAEWEYACRAGTKTRYYSGDDPETLASVANVADANYRAKFPDHAGTIKGSDGCVFTAPVGQFKPNVFGLYDMHGNVWQWCSDWHGDDYYGKSPRDDPTGADTGDFRVVRGGSWHDGPTGARSAARFWFTPVHRSAVVGFRVASTDRLCDEDDIKAGLWVIRNRSFRGDDLIECADYLVNLTRLEDSFAVEVAEVYRTWQAWDPKAFQMATDDPVRNRVLTKMRDLAKGKEAKTTIQHYIDRFDADRDNFKFPSSQLDIDPKLLPHP